MPAPTSNLQEIFPVCRRLLDPDMWLRLTGPSKPGADPESFSETLARRAAELNLPPYLPDLARIELAIRHALTKLDETDATGDNLRANPTLSLIDTGWLGLPAIFRPGNQDAAAPRSGRDHVLVWRQPGSTEAMVRSARSEELLALKLVVEKLDTREIARGGRITLAQLDRAVRLAVARGLILAPPAALRRDPAVFAAEIEIADEFLVAETFTLQWHLTQACDLHCRHCYDRSSRTAPTLAEAMTTLDQLYDFCRERRVSGQISFTGGNPLLHPDFLAIYRGAAERGFMTAILGNPTTPAMLAAITAIRKPEFFQVSLEGLAPHNDYIRGAGHFDRVMRFLDELRQAGIYAMVMLTLTRDNLGQVLALGEILRGRADLFTFNRLSAVGEGAQLTTPGREEYAAFLPGYLAAARANPTLALKDNLINILRLRDGGGLFGGCAGFGCGAAFNFVALLPDGEVHACRKFPSAIGHLKEQTLGEIHDSANAARYRRGPEQCRGCRVRHVCGGCLAVIASQGLDPTRDRDPCCFID